MWKIDGKPSSYGGTLMTMETPWFRIFKAKPPFSESATARTPTHSTAQISDCSEGATVASRTDGFTGNYV